MSATLDPFDPYRDWLGIQPQESAHGGLDHYRLLGLPRFESDARRIAAAADERMALVRSFQVGPRKVHTQRLLNELSAARICLLSPAAKATYDATLRSVGVSPAPDRAIEPPSPPPIQPPAPPEPRVILATEEDKQVTIAPTAAWWRPLATMLLAAFLVLAGAIGWGIWQANRPGPTNIVLQPVPTPPQPEPEPEPAAPEPVVQYQEGNGEVNLPPATALLSGDVALRNAGTGELLAGFGDAASEARWKFRLVLPGFFQLEMKYATAIEPDGAALEATVAGQSKTCDLRSTGGRDEFLADTFTIAIPKSGEHTLVLRPVQHPSGDWLILKSVRLIPIGAPAPPVLTP